MERIDPRLLPKREPRKKKDPEEKLEIRLEQLTYTIPQLAKAMPGISRQTIENLIDSGDIRSIPPRRVERTIQNNPEGDAGGGSKKFSREVLIRGEGIRT